MDSGFGLGSRPRAHVLAASFASFSQVGKPFGPVFEV